MAAIDAGRAEVLNSRVAESIRTNFADNMHRKATCGSCNCLICTFTTLCGREVAMTKYCFVGNRKMRYLNREISVNATNNHDRHRCSLGNLGHAGLDCLYFGLRLLAPVH